MTDHTPLPVSGYKPQSQETIDLVNEGKILEEQVMRYFDKLLIHTAILLAAVSWCLPGTVFPRPCASFFSFSSSFALLSHYAHRGRTRMTLGTADHVRLGISLQCTEPLSVCLVQGEPSPTPPALPHAMACVLRVPLPF